MAAWRWKRPWAAKKWHHEPQKAGLTTSMSQTWTLLFLSPQFPLIMTAMMIGAGRSRSERESNVKTIRIMHGLRRFSPHSRDERYKLSAVYSASVNAQWTVQKPSPVMCCMLCQSQKPCPKRRMCHACAFLLNLLPMKSVKPQQSVLGFFLKRRTPPHPHSKIV